jgi:ankyrin repeat protein
LIVNGYPILEFCVLNDSPKFAELLIKEGHDIQPMIIKANNGHADTRNKILALIGRNCIETIELLLNNGFNTNPPATMLAIVVDQPKIFYKFVSHGADLGFLSRYDIARMLNGPNSIIYAKALIEEVLISILISILPLWSMTRMQN